MTLTVTPQQEHKAFVSLMSRCEGTENPTACWIFTGYVTKQGYSRIGIGRSSVPGHRLAYANAHGMTLSDLADTGLVLDHLCRTPSCVNAAHLELVTRRENTVRGMQLITHCPQGHEYTLDNLRNSYGRGRSCRTCYLDLRRRMRLAQRLRSSCRICRTEMFAYNLGQHFWLFHPEVPR